MGDVIKEESLETCFEKLNLVIETLDKEGITLEESFAKYDEGMKLIKECKEKLDMYEKKLIMINEEE
ncbi:MAG: exodeoxyribonuclease VII small subunit [Lachnospiraceae bacterium]|nr:exodeoxyribonuclease VII small subunit [Lachnospiraceae bacterium]